MIWRQRLGLERKLGGADIIFEVVIVALACLALQIEPSAAASMCTSLAGLSLPQTKITLARLYRAGDMVSGVTKAPVGLCRVTGTSKPSSDSNINFEVWIPTNGRWNGKYEQIGNGGFAGTIWVSYIADAVSRGYAAAATDDGTSGPPLGAATFIGHPNVLKDFGYRAIKVTTDNSKAIIKRLMGKTPRYSYFSGCSQGGLEAFTEAQRYPRDYDGIIAGDPANYWTHLYAGGHLWIAQATLTDSDSYIPATKLQAIGEAVYAACDSIDGIKDGILNDPRLCHFDPSVLLCKSGDAQTCLTAPQVEAVKKIYQGARTSDGEQVFPGIMPGGEAGQGGWNTWITGTDPGRDRSP